MTANDILGSLMTDLGRTYSATHGGYTFSHDGKDYELIIDESFYADGDPARHEARATIWREVWDEEEMVDSAEVSTVRIIVEVVA
jgi:hypothetical protein